MKLGQTTKTIFNIVNLQRLICFTLKILI